MLRKIIFWLHLWVGVTAGFFIFVMAATGVLLSFEKQVIDFVDHDIRYVSVPQDAQQRGINGLLESVRRAGIGEPTAIVIRNQPEAAMQFLIGRSKAVYVDPYSCAVLGVSSMRALDFFSAVERLHRSLGAPPGSKNTGHWLAALSNLLFGVLVVLGVVLWVPRQWSWKALRASMAFRTGLRAKAREWNWHNVVGIWCALPLLVIVLTGVVMSFDWANALLFRFSGSAPVAHAHDAGERRRGERDSGGGMEPNYLHLLEAAKTIDPAWRTITLNIARDPNAPVSVVVDAGTGGQPQKRAQYLLQRDTGAIIRSNTFAGESLGQRLRAFVRFGHTGEYGGLLGQAFAAMASLGACVLVYTGLSLAIRRVAVRRRRHGVVAAREAFTEHSVV